VLLPTTIIHAWHFVVVVLKANLKTQKVEEEDGDHVSASLEHFIYDCF